jgi:hypothetical protein
MLLINSFHPLFAHLPLTLVVLIVSFYAWEWFNDQSVPQLEYILLVMLSISCAVAFASGWFAQDSASRMFTVPEEEIAFHFKLARASLILSCVSLIIRYLMPHASSVRNKNILRILYRLAVTALITLIATTSHAGGSLVYLFGAGISKI